MNCIQIENHKICWGTQPGNPGNQTLGITLIKVVFKADLIYINPMMFIKEMEKNE
jgi:hypothetical protein